MSDIDITPTRAAIEKVAKQELPEVTASTPLDDLPIDSLDLFTVIGDLEDATGRGMEDDELDGISTVGELAKHFYA